MSERNYWWRMRRTRMNRRSLLRASARAGVGAAGLALVGCGDDDDETAQQSVAQAQSGSSSQQSDSPQASGDDQQEQAASRTAQQADDQDSRSDSGSDQQSTTAAASSDAPKMGGINRAATTINTHDYWDPHRGVFGPTQFMHSLMYNNIIRWQNKERGVMESDLAQLPEIPDSETYIFTVTDGARWQDKYPTEGGREVVAEDLAFNIDRQVNAVDSTGAEDGTFLSSTSWRSVVQRDATDERTLVCKSDGIDSTFLGAAFLNPFAWMAAPEGIQEWGLDSDVWRDDPTQLLTAASGPFIGEFFDPTDRFIAVRNPNYWKTDQWGQQLPYLDEYRTFNIFDETTVDTALRNKELEDAGLNVSRVDQLLIDFPDMVRRTLGGGFTIIIRGNFSTEWEGEDGQGNPWADRRVWAAYHMATNRQLMIDTVYLGSAKPTALAATPWFSSFWAPSEDELITFRGYRTNKDLDNKEANDLLDAAGFDRSREIQIILPDVWEERYPGIRETTIAMYADAIGMNVNVILEPYTIILQRLVDGSYPGDGPNWTNPPSNLDPTTWFYDSLRPGGSINFWSYDYPRVTALVEEMKVTLDQDVKQQQGREVVGILMGEDQEAGLEGISPEFGVMNPVSHRAAWPWYHPNEDVFQFGHANHNHDTTWIDTEHPEIPDVV